MPRMAQTVIIYIWHKQNTIEVLIHVLINRAAKKNLNVRPLGQIRAVNHIYASGTTFFTFLLILFSVTLHWNSNIQT